MLTPSPDGVFLMTMPGLFGIIASAGQPDKDVFHKLADHIRPEYIEPHISKHHSAFLGFKSLRVLDPINQPFINSEHDLTLFIWGEIYDYPDKQKSVSENIFDLYLSDKLDELIDLNGCYSFSLWDNKRSRLVLASDIYATRPLFFYHSSDQFYFSPSVFGLARPLQKMINRRALNHFMQIGMITAKDTWFKDIYKLTPGSILIYEHSKITIRKYFDPKFVPQDISVFDSATGIVDHLKTVIGRYKKEKFSLSLSGGGDSRLIAALCKQQGYEFKSFTFSGEKAGDLDVSRLVSKKLELVHYPLLISPDYLSEFIRDAVYNTNGYCSAINFHGISTRTEVRKLAGVALSGLYGNNFLGYMSFAIQKFASVTNKEKFITLLSAWLNSGYSQRELEDFCTGPDFEPLEEISSSLFKKYQQESYLDTLLAIDHFEINSQRSLCGFWLENDMVEYRTPFCDYNLMKYNLTIPGKHKLLMQIGREIWRTHFEELGQIIYQRTELPINAPASMVAIKKMLNKVVGTKPFPGILDYADIFRNELSGWINDFLTGRDCLNIEFLNPETVKEIISDHQNKKADNSNKIGLLLTFEQVLRILKE